MPEPSVPPTPPVPLSALLAREDLGLRQIAGPSDPDIVIHWVHTSEMADPYPYLLGGELLLSAGVHIPEAAGSGTYFDDYVGRIVAAGGAALGFGLAPVHDTVPRALVAACEAYGLPLIEVPPRTTFSGIARAVWQLMAEARTAELRRVTEAQQSLASAASRPDPIPSVLRRLSQRLGGLAVLYGPDGTRIAWAGREPGNEARAALETLAEVVRPTRAQATAPQPTRAPAPQSRRAQSPVLRTAETPAPGPRPAQAQTAGQPVQAQTPGPQPAQAQTHGPQPGQAQTPGPQPARAQTHGPQPGQAQTPGPQPARAQTPGPQPAQAQTHGPQPAQAQTPGPQPAQAQTPGPQPGQAQAPIPRPEQTPAPASSPAPTSATDTVAGTHLAAYALGTGQGFVLGVAASRREAGDHTIASVAAVLLSLLTGEHQSGAGAARGSALVRLLLGARPEDVAPLLGAGRWVVVHARPADQSPDAVAASALGAALGSALVDLARDVVRVLVPADREPAPQPGWTLGISAAVAPHEWPAADTQAARALARARATRTALVRHGSRPGLGQLVAPDEAQAYARELLAPLAEHPALTETLRTWLSLHGSWDRTAVALAVHRNTVRQRISRCAALLGTDLDDPDVRMELWFALGQV
ncbi:PucR family transcriptional regulator ligand-binding domain-containing protein [Streptomyces sp. NPDC001982]|uniref:PucR family transcriptional regulator ligand-binding domain-containing protein n=1 Tax=Streptomyces sp. NPDC001982 TaxID=3154405 RepID=UPI00332D713B